jgi:hypothetical protein
VSISRVEEAHNDIVTLVEAIKTGGGYRSDVKAVSKQFLDINALSLLPQVSVLLGQEKMKSVDSNGTVWNSQVDVYLLGYSTQANMETLLHDLKVCLVTMFKTNIANSTNRWHVCRTQDYGPVIVSRDVLAGTEKGWVCCQFSIQIDYQATTL